MAHLSISIDATPELDPAAVEAAFLAAGALSVTLSDSRDDPVLEPAPGEVRLWPATRLTALFAGEASSAALLVDIARAAGVPLQRLRVETVPERAWEREWLKDFRPLRFGRRLWVAPHHAAVEAADALVVRLDPGLAFGTGTHPSTALCLEWLDAHPPCGQDVIDYGCGSGILALAAARLGARRIECCDIDPQALLATAENAAANGLQARLCIRKHPEELAGAADLLLANILAGALCELAPRLAALLRPGASVVLAGLLESQQAEVAAAFAPWFDVAPFARRDGWIGLAGARH